MDSVWQDDNDEEFLKMMFMDGCFMLEIQVTANQTLDYALNDPIFGSHGMFIEMTYLKRDMLNLKTSCLCQFFRS